MSEIRMSGSLKNNTILTILDEESYKREEIEWIDQHIANQGDGLYFHDYNSSSFNPHVYNIDERANLTEKNGEVIAGIYIAGVILFYLFFLILILRRYGIKCRNCSILNEATAEQGDWFCCNKRCNDTEDGDRDCESQLLESWCCQWKNEVRNQAEVYNLNEMQESPVQTESEQEEKEEGQQVSEETEWISVLEKEKVNFDSYSLRSLDSLYTIEECPSKEDLYD